MIARTPEDITAAVLAELQRAEDVRWREIMTAAVTHLHAFVKDARLTEGEFQQACRTIAQLGQMTTTSHNEVVLASGSLGVSALVCLLNNGDRGEKETTANLMGPFWRQGAPLVEQGGSIVHAPTPGDPVFVSAWVRDAQGLPVEGAEVHVWQASSEGFYENQDPAQADMNLRGRLITDAQGRIAFRSIKPAAYPIPTRGPVGAAARAGAAQHAPGAHPLPDPQARLQGAVLAGLFERRPVPRHRRAVCGDARAGGPVRAARRGERARACRRCARPVVLARTSLRDRARRRPAAAGADQCEG